MGDEDGWTLGLLVARLQQYQEIQRVRAAEKESLEKEIPITAPMN
ncbi:MAG: hypothetical protein ABSG32_08760 [Terriglobia bacterium]